MTSSPSSKPLQLAPLWRLLPRTLALHMPRPSLLQELDDELLGWLEQTGCACSGAFRPNDPYPCTVGAQPTCAMRVAEDGRTVVCGLGVPECAPRRFTSDEAVQVRISAEALVHLVQRSLGLAPCWKKTEEEPMSAIPLGRRAFGSRTVDCVLLVEPENALVRRWLETLTREHPERALAVVVVHRDELPLSTPPDNQLWLALADALPTPDGLQLDLLPLWDRFAPGIDPGEKSWPPFLFVAHPENLWYRYAGRELDLHAHPLHNRLLARLLLKRGSWQTRRVLVKKIWPEERVRAETFDRKWANVRGLKSELTAMLKGLRLPADVDPEPIENKEDEDGGYRIADHHAIRWLSAPHEDLQDRVRPPRRPRTPG